MFRIAICDASKEYRNVTADIWRRAFFDEEDLTFSFYATGGEVVEAIEDGTFVHDVLILDLLLPDVSGLRLLNFVRGQFQDLTIILQTESAELAVYGYRFGVFDFLVKHSSLKEIERVINRFKAEKAGEQNSVLTVMIQGTPQRLILNRIMFFESDARRIHAFGPDEDATFYMKMDELEAKVREAGFVRCHQSYLVNRSWIRGLASGTLILTNKNELPVSRRYLKDLREALGA